MKKVFSCETQGTYVRATCLKYNSKKQRRVSQHSDRVFPTKGWNVSGAAHEQKAQAVTTLQQAAKPHPHHSYMPGWLVHVLQSAGEIWDASISGHLISPGDGRLQLHFSADEDYGRQEVWSSDEEIIVLKPLLFCWGSSPLEASRIPLWDLAQLVCECEWGLSHLILSAVPSTGAAAPGEDKQTAGLCITRRNFWAAEGLKKILPPPRMLNSPGSYLITGKSLWGCCVQPSPFGWSGWSDLPPLS